MQLSGTQTWSISGSSNKTEGGGVQKRFAVTWGIYMNFLEWAWGWMMLRLRGIGSRRCPYINKTPHTRASCLPDNLFSGQTNQGDVSLDVTRGERLRAVFVFSLDFFPEEVVTERAAFLLQRSWRVRGYVKWWERFCDGERAMWWREVWVEAVDKNAGVLFTLQPFTWQS